MPPRPTTPREAVAALHAGNRRFMHEAHLLFEKHSTQLERAALGSHGQHPFAVVVACADSRVAPEIIFDAGLGDLFVVRSAGHVVDSAAIASVEFAVQHLGALAIAVIGHKRCGAIAAAVAAFRAEERRRGEAAAAAVAGDVESKTASRHLPALVDGLVPCVRAAAERLVADVGDAQLVEEALCENVRRVVRQISESSPPLAHAVAAGKLVIEGFRYDIDSPPDEKGESLEAVVAQL